MSLGVGSEYRFVCTCLRDGCVCMCGCVCVCALVCGQQQNRYNKLLFGETLYGAEVSLSLIQQCHKTKQNNHPKMRNLQDEKPIWSPSLSWHFPPSILFRCFFFFCFLRTSIQPSRHRRAHGALDFSSDGREQCRIQLKSLPLGFKIIIPPISNLLPAPRDARLNHSCDHFPRSPSEETDMLVLQMQRFRISWCRCSAVLLLFFFLLVLDTSLAVRFKWVSLSIHPFFSSIPSIHRLERFTQNPINRSFMDGCTVPPSDDR